MNMPDIVYQIVTLCTLAFDAAAIGAHRRFVDGLRAAGKPQAQGPFGDASGDASLVRAASRADADAIVTRDPLVVAGATRATACEWSVR